MYYVKQVKFDTDAGKFVTSVLLSSKEEALAIGVCSRIAHGFIESYKPGLNVSLRVYDGNRIIFRVDCIVVDNSIN